MNKKRFALSCIAMACVVLVIASCGGDTPLTPEQMPFAGHWVAADGSSVNIQPTGAADCDVGGTKVTNGSIKFEGPAITIGLMGLGKTLQVTQPPSTTPDGRTTLGLEGVIYTRQ